VRSRLICPFCQSDADWPRDIVVVYPQGGNGGGSARPPERVRGDRHARGQLGAPTPDWIRQSGAPARRRRARWIGAWASSFARARWSCPIPRRPAPQSPCSTWSCSRWPPVNRSGSRGHRAPARRRCSTCSPA
jgi:hypothetical protein